MANIPNFADLANYRYNSFSNTVTPKLIGYGANDTEDRTIPGTSPYLIILHEVPQLNTPSTTEITDTTTSTILEEVSKTTTPGNNQYRVNYDAKGLGQVEFNSAQAGHSISIKYYGEGAINKVENYQSSVNRIEAADYINSLYVSGGDIILDESILFGASISQQNLGAINILAASEWYFVVTREDTQAVSLQRLSTLTPATFPASWSPTLASNQLDMLEFFDAEKNYCWYDVGGVNYRIIALFKTNSTPDNFVSGSNIKIKNKPKTYIKLTDANIQNITNVTVKINFDNIIIDTLSEISGTAANRTYTAKETKLINSMYFFSVSLNGGGFFSYIYYDGTEYVKNYAQEDGTTNSDRQIVSLNYPVNINKNSTLEIYVDCISATEIENSGNIEWLINEYAYI